MIYLISGLSGSGKSAISKELAKKLKKSFYIEVDKIRELVISGYSSPFKWDKETSRQFELATLNTIALAKNAERYGFEVIIDDVVFMEQEKLYLQMLPEAKRIWICPNLETIQKRNIEREKNIPSNLVSKLYSHLSYREEDRNWIRLDTSNLSVSESIEAILHLIE